MSVDDAKTALAHRADISEDVGSSADSDVLAPYFALPQPRLLLDVRPELAFHRAHIVGSYNVTPISKLRSQYSYLPPRNTPFVVLAELSQYSETVEAFAQTPSVIPIYLAPDELDADPTVSGNVISEKRFVACAQRLGVLRKSLSHQSRLAGGHCSDSTSANRDDIPELLFRPSNAVRRTVLSLESRYRHQDKALRVLDLGCGAARDLAWILHGSRTRTPTPSWTGVGVDNWKAALLRAEQLMNDLWLNHDDTSLPLVSPCCEKLMWAKCADDGILEPLVGTGKGKSIRTAENHVQLWEQYRQLGLSPLLSSARDQQVTNSSDDETAKFDLVLCIRFHPRALLPHVSRLVRAGGMVLLSHFATLSEAQLAAASQVDPTAITDYDSPPHQGRIQPGEIESLVQSWNQSERPGYTWIIDSDVLEPIEDGRIIKSVGLCRVSV